MIQTGQYNCMLAVGDLHVPDHDEAAFGAVVALAKKLKPDILLNTGDWWGCHNFGRWKQKVPPELRLKSGRNANLAAGMFDELLTTSGAEGHVVKSNHEDRLRGDVWAHNPELWTIDSIREGASIPEVLGYREAGAVYHEKPWRIRDWLLCEHGETVRKWGGQSVRPQMVERVGLCLVMGHSHRLAIVGVTQDAGDMWGLETGCLCKNPPDYSKTGRVEDWQQGCAVVWLHKRKPIVRYELCPIEDGVLWWRGMELSG